MNWDLLLLKPLHSGVLAENLRMTQEIPGHIHNSQEQSNVSLVAAMKATWLLPLSLIKALCLLMATNRVKQAGLSERFDQALACSLSLLAPTCPGWPCVIIPVWSIGTWFWSRWLSRMSPPPYRSPASTRSLSSTWKLTGGTLVWSHPLTWIFDQWLVPLKGLFQHCSSHQPPCPWW